MSLIDWAEKSYLPDWMIRIGIRRLLATRLGKEHAGNAERASARGNELLTDLRRSAVAIETDAANRQHYEVPAAFYQQVLGPHMKYSSALWSEGTTTLADAERAMLEQTCANAGLSDGQRILELGCGWGSLTLHMAEQYPASRIVAVSNSASQRRYIERQLAERGLENVTVLTRDVNQLELDERFDGVVSVEMFEHVRNYRELLARIAGWLAADGRLFVHIFCHRYLAYPFETEGPGDWMGRHFFTGGLMPAADTLLFFPEHMAIEKRWLYSGTHYARTARAWLDNADRNRQATLAALQSAHPDDSARWLQRWRMFFMACEELFAWRGGNTWLVAHYRFRKQ